MKSFNSLRLRLTAVCTVSTGLVLVAMAVISFSISAEQLTNRYAEQFYSDCITIRANLREQTLLSHSWLKQTEAQSGIILSVQSKTSRMLYEARDSEREALTTAALNIASERYGFSNANGKAPAVDFEMTYGLDRCRSSVFTVRMGNNLMTVTAVKNRQWEDAQLAWLRNRFVGAVAAALVCLVVVAWFFSGWAARPVEDSRKRQIALIGAASHEFRSPVAVIRMGAENLKTASPELAGRFTDIILRESGRLSRLTEDMLRIASADNHSLPVHFEEVNPESIALTVYESFQELARKNEITLTVELPENPLPRVPCDRERIEQLLSILMDNALRFTPKGGKIAIGVCHQKKKVVFSISDSGSGISDEDKQHIFDRFYRSDTARSDKEHYGLGLSIAKEIALLHKGALTVADGQSGGSVFNFTLPI